MYATDATHFLDAKGAFGPQRGQGAKPGRVPRQRDRRGDPADPGRSPARLQQCSGPIEVAVGPSDEIQWRCSACAEAGRISNWRHTLWDMTKGGTTEPS